MSEKRYRIRLGNTRQHSGALTKTEAEESAKWARRFGVKAAIIEEPASTVASPAASLAGPTFPCLHNHTGQ
jgi:hypothetical protein